METGSDDYRGYYSDVAHWSFKPWAKYGRERVYVTGYRSNRKPAGSRKYPERGYFDQNGFHWDGLVRDEARDKFEDLKAEAEAMFRQVFANSETGEGDFDYDYQVPVSDVEHDGLL